MALLTRRGAETRRFAPRSCGQTSPGASWVLSKTVFSGGWGRGRPVLEVRDLGRERRGAKVARFLFLFNLQPRERNEPLLTFHLQPGSLVWLRVARPTWPPHH